MLKEQGRWRLILNVVDHLPAHSAYGDAIAQDDELVALQGLPDGPGMAPTPSFAEFTPIVAAVVDLKDTVAMLRSEVWSLAGQKRPPTYRPSPRPSGALDRLAAAHAKRQADDVVVQLFGPRDGGDD